MRLKASIEKATARRIARESMELIEDDRLELMELAAASKGLPSIVSLDHDTLQNLESFRGNCCFSNSKVNYHFELPIMHSHIFFSLPLNAFM